MASWEIDTRSIQTKAELFNCAAERPFETEPVKEAQLYLN
jgi:hypothetical protein